MKLYKIIETERRIFLVMEWVKGGPLKALIQARVKEGNKFSDEEAAKIMRALLSGVDYIHSKDIVHRDLKPGNSQVDTT